MEKYQGNLDFPAYNFVMADNGVKQAGRTDYAVWTSRALLAALFLFAALVIRKGRLAGSGIGTPLFLSAFTFGVLEAFTSFSAPLFVITTGVPVLVYFFGLRFTVFGARGSGGFALSLLPALAFLGIILAVSSVRGPYYFWFNVWTSGFFRTAFASSAVILLLTHYYLVYSYARGTLGARKLAGRMFFLTGSLASLYGLVYVVFGIDRTLGRINDEILMMPVMVSRVLGFSTHLDFLVVINEAAVKAGVVIAVAGLLMAGFGWRKFFSRGGDTPAEKKQADNAVPVRIRKP